MTTQSDRAAHLPADGAVVAGRYRVERVIARGGMGVVYLAEHIGLARKVALKFILANTAIASARFLREARAAARLSSPHVVRIFDVGEHVAADGATTPFLAMELLVGADLHGYLDARGALPIDEAVEIILQTCEALAEAHAAGIVHRDLKPSNLFLGHRADGSPLVKLLDFGIAKASVGESWSADLNGRLTAPLETIGSPLYMSPEHLRDSGSVDARTDIWSLGVLLHELLTRRHPFEASSSIDFGMRVASGEPTPIRAHFPEAPEGLEKIIVRCLQRDRTARFPSVAALARALVPFAKERAHASLAGIERASSPSEDATVESRKSAPIASSPASSSIKRPATPSRVAPTPPSIQRAAPRPPMPTSTHSSVSLTDRFRRQHEELQELGFAINAKLNRESIPAEASEVRRMVAKFAGKVAVHASMENEALYPRLFEHPDPIVRARAKSLFDEVGSIYASFKGYSREWPTVSAIEADPRGFVRATREALKTLGMRMMREDQELYPLVDQSEEASTQARHVCR